MQGWFGTIILTFEANIIRGLHFLLFNVILFTPLPIYTFFTFQTPIICKVFLFFGAFYVILRKIA